MHSGAPKFRPILRFWPRTLIPLLALLLATSICLGVSRQAPLHIAMEYGADTLLGWGRFDFQGDSWPPATNQPVPITIVKCTKYEKDNGEAYHYEILHILRGESFQPGETIKVFDRFGLGFGRLGLLIGDPTQGLTTTSRNFRSIPLGSTPISDVISVVQSTLAIQQKHPSTQIPERNQELNNRLEHATEEILLAWLVIFPEWLEQELNWNQIGIHKAATNFEHIIRAELKTEDNRDYTPALTALHLFAKTGAPELPLDLLLNGLDRKRSLRNISAELLSRRTGDDRKEVITKMRSILGSSRPDERCWRICQALAKMNATDAAPEIKTYYKRTQYSNQKHYALAALSLLDLPSSEELLLQKMQRVRTFGAGYFNELARICNNGQLKPADIVPYLVEACNGCALVNQSSSDTRNWLMEITGIDSDQTADYKNWWVTRKPNTPWPIKAVRQHGKLSNLEFIIE